MHHDKTRKWLPLPCPAYDIEGMETWLREQAGEGWQLSEDGFFCGFGAFDKATPRVTDFRLSVDVRGKSIMDGADGPEDELTDYSRMCGWEYVAKRGDFYVWRSNCAERQELDTDPQVKALALDVIRKRQRSAAISCLLWGLVYPLIKLRGGVLLSMVNLGTGFVLLGLLLVIWFFCAAGVKAVGLSRLRKAILAGTAPQTKRKRIRYYWLVAARWVLTILWIYVGFSRVSAYVTEDGEIPLKEYGENPPFATVVDFAAADEKDYQLLNFGFSNTVRQWEDWLAPVNYDWDEIAAVTMPDGQKLEGILFVEYHEVRFPWAARRIAREYWWNEQWEKGYEKLRAPKISADFCVAYLDNIHTPTVVICMDNKVICASFRTYSGSINLPLESWSEIIANSLR